ncbi:MAG: hypothetical protein B6243_07315, partial [Anaerolineaceae bacterium 4572_5.2]
MKKSLLIVFVLTLALVLTACGGAPAAPEEPAAPVAEEPVAEEPAAEEPAAEEPAAEEPAEPFKVAIIMPSSITDLAFSQSMFDALLAVQA